MAMMTTGIESCHCGPRIQTCKRLHGCTELVPAPVSTVYANECSIKLSGMLIIPFGRFAHA